MQPRDRFRFLRSLGMGLGSLLLLSGAVLAAGSGSRADGRPLATASASEHARTSTEPSRSPEIDAFVAGEVDEASESPEASPQGEAMDATGDDEAEDGSFASTSTQEGGHDGSAPDAQDCHAGSGGREHDSCHDDHGAGHGGEDD
jgi:hypothetical protein